MKSPIPDISPKGKYRQFRVNDDEMDSGYGFSLSEGDIVFFEKIFFIFVHNL